jgi:hypothetical protein
MSEMQCPHCHTLVPQGARVCTGCQAEVEYGTPGGAIVALLVGALFLGYQAASATGSQGVGIVLGIAVVGAGGWVFSRMFADRAEFKRVYKTR